MHVTIDWQSHRSGTAMGEIRAVDITYTPSHFYTKTTRALLGTPRAFPEPPRLDPVVNYRVSNKLATKDAQEPRGDHQAARQRRYTARRPL